MSGSLRFLHTGSELRLLTHAHASRGQHPIESVPVAATDLVPGGAMSELEARASVPLAIVEREWLDCPAARVRCAAGRPAISDSTQRFPAQQNANQPVAGTAISISAASRTQRHRERLRWWGSSFVLRLNRRLSLPFGMSYVTHVCGIRPKETPAGTQRTTVAQPPHSVPGSPMHRLKARRGAALYYLLPCGWGEAHANDSSRSRPRNIIGTTADFNR